MSRADDGGPLKDPSGLDVPFVGDWEDVVEALTDGELHQALEDRGIVVDTSAIRVTGCVPGHEYRFDVLVYGRKDFVLLDARTTLRLEDAEMLMEKLEIFRGSPFEIAFGKAVHGALAHIEEEPGAAAHAERSGLFVVRMTEGGAVVANDAGFKPRDFRPPVKEPARPRRP